MLDLLVSFTLLAAAMSIVSPLVVRHGHLLRSQRNYRLALDELSNQMEHLTTLPPDKLSDAMQQLAPMSFVAERLNGAKLSGEIRPAENGSQITLQLSWNETTGRNSPVMLTTWVFPGPATTTEAPQP